MKKIVRISDNCRSQSGVYIAGIAFFCLLQILYFYYIQPIYAYDGFVREFNHGRFIIGWICYIPVLSVLAQTQRREKLSWIITSVILLCNYTPGLVLYIYRETDFILLFLLYYGVLLGGLVLFDRITIAQIFTFKDDRFFNVLGLILGSIIIFIWIRYAHCRFQLSLLDVYEQRSEFLTYNIPTILVYMYTMAQSVMPVFAVYSLWRKKYVKLICYVVLQYFAFCIDASKSAVFMMIFALGMYFIIKIIQNYFSYIPWLLCGGILLAFVEKVVLHTLYITAVFYRRVFFVPTKLNYDFYNFFSMPSNEFDFYRSSLDFLGSSPYKDDGIPILIGRFNGSGASANNGMFSDAYANLGICGMIVMPIMIMVIFKLLELVSANLPSEITVSVVIMISLVYISSSFFTNLLSHGVALTILVLFLIPKGNIYEEHRCAL